MIERFNTSRSLQIHQLDVYAVQISTDTIWSRFAEENGLGKKLFESLKEAPCYDFKVFAYSC